MALISLTMIISRKICWTNAKINGAWNCHLQQVSPKKLLKIINYSLMWIVVNICQARKLRQQISTSLTDIEVKNNCFSMYHTSSKNAAKNYTSSVSDKKVKNDRFLEFHTPLDARRWIYLNNHLQACQSVRAKSSIHLRGIIILLLIIIIIIIIILNKVISAFLILFIHLLVLK